MKIRTVSQSFKSMEVTEGAGVTVYRSIGTPPLKNLDPFLMLDHFGSDNPDEYIAGFPEHPHRGFITLTYMLDGHMQHQDSMGNKGDLMSGGAQWMKAASGVIHSEMPQQTNGLMRGFQLWINLPASEKMSMPGYQEYSPSSFPIVEIDGGKVKVLCGNYGGTSGPIVDPFTSTEYLDVELEAAQSFTYEIDTQLNCFVYVYEGEAAAGDTTLQQHYLAVLSSGDAVQVSASSKMVRFILVAGKPIQEPIVQYGPFVMNSRAEIEQAFFHHKSSHYE